MSEKGFVELHNTETLDKFLGSSNGAPVILFKHSNSCPFSSQAHREMAELERPVGIVTVQKERAVSDEIVRRFGLPHETPQVLIVQNGAVVWNASHGQVKAFAVEEALEAAVSSKR